ncbi:LPXTG cell wall anchor domain-containing protein [Curtobacterium oceanosedimentum]|nr:LPXTG cell wall anchor domain-containing protein [Curtobacterium oceanosedimentum]MCA5923945.1 LPXTG cell wall anchor domain-containing protein [Curtobacterium oceanosedimentum]
MDATSVIWTVVIAVIAVLSLSAGGWRLRRRRRDDRRDG